MDGMYSTPMIILPSTNTVHHALPIHPLVLCLVFMHDRDRPGSSLE